MAGSRDCISNKGLEINQDATWGWLLQYIFRRYEDYTVSQIWKRLKIVFVFAFYQQSLIVKHFDEMPMQNVYQILFNISIL